jgi:hypothetical protein
VGKTAIAEGLAQRIVMNDVPENLKVGLRSGSGFGFGSQSGPASDQPQNN